MNKTKTIIIWSVAGIICAGVLFYLMDLMIQSRYASYPEAYDQPEMYKKSMALFFSGVIQLGIGFLLMKPVRKTYYVPTGRNEYRDPFVGLDREELSDHGYGIENTNENKNRKLQGFIFLLPSVLVLAYAAYIATVLYILEQWK